VTFQSEEQLAAHVVAWLQEWHWDVYQEVAALTNDAVADIVAVQGPLLYVIECKRSLSLQVIAQAERWRCYANLVSVATPAGRERAQHGFARRHLFEPLGIGWLKVDGPISDSCDGIRERVTPRKHRRTIARLRDALRDEHRTFAKAGNARGSYWTPFQATCREVQAAVSKRPGITMKELVDSIRHHYASTASARNTLAKWIQQGIVEGVEARREGRALRLYPVERDAA